MPDIFADNAKLYVERGFTPMPWRVIDGGKRPVAKGYLLPNPPVQEWRVVHASAGIGIVSRGWLGVDVDSAEHADKTGDQTIAMLEGSLGQLPITFSSTARGHESKSRIYFFAIPDDGRRYRDVGKDVEAIRPGHRFAAVAPSVHPNGKPYVWYDKSGAPMDGPPHLYELPPLPDRWIEYLTAPAPRDGGYDGSVQDWLDALPGEEAPDFIKARLAFTEGEFGHSDLVKILTSLVASGARGHRGIRQAIELVRDHWLRDLWDDAEHYEEFDNVLDWAVSRAGSPPATEEDVVDDAEERFQQLVDEEPETIIDRQALAQSLRTYCQRLAPDFELIIEENESVSSKYRQCVELLPGVNTEADIKTWLTATKTAMERVLTREATL